MGQGAGKRLQTKANKFKKKKAQAKVLGARKERTKDNRCHLCKKEGHYQKDCLKRKAWFEKKCKPNFVYVSNQTQLKFLIILGGLTMVLLFMYPT